MNKPEPKPSDQITLLVFKDNHAARTFQISLGWLSRLGLIGGLMVAITLLSAFFAIKYYRTAHRMDPSHVEEIEQELSDLKLSYQTLEAKNLTAVPALSEGTAPIAQTQVQASAMPNAPTVTETLATGPTQASGASPLFSALPSGTLLVQDPAKISISIDTPKFSWSGKTLKTRFSIQYTREDRGSQNGHIVLLARGPETLLAYPSGIFRKSGSASLIAPGKGEYFSVGRFREVKAEFGAAPSSAAIQELEILIFNQNGEILIHRSVPVQAAPRRQIEAEPSPHA